jgi:hypothetical protein
MSPNFYVFDIMYTIFEYNSHLEKFKINIHVLGIWTWNLFWVLLGNEISEIQDLIELDPLQFHPTSFYSLNLFTPSHLFSALSGFFILCSYLSFSVENKQTLDLTNSIHLPGSSEALSPKGRSITSS